MSNEWYARQFGTRDQFAIAISLGQNPHPIGDLDLDASWGGLAIWVRGRCLTRNVSNDGGVSDEVRWSLASVLQWMNEVVVRLVNEDPFPYAVSSDRVRDGCDWFNASETPPLTLTEQEEEAWFLRRSEWRNHHALRRAAMNVALPNLVIRRFANFLEVSWDNQAWGASRPEISFVEQRGTELVDAAAAARDLQDAVIDATSALAKKTDSAGFRALAEAAAAAGASEDDWRWLIHPRTAETIESELTDVRDRLNQHTRIYRNAAYIPHTPETLLLRQARVVSSHEIQSLVDVAHPPAGQPLSEALGQLIRPSQASTLEPWREGYDRAQDTRDALGWGDDPLPDLSKWLKENHVSLSRRNLSSSVDLVAIRTSDCRGSVVVNPQGQSPLSREIGLAAALGHVLFDVTPVAVEGTWEHWPTAARARAFAAMLLLPDDGVRRLLGGKSTVDAADVRSVMERFNTGPYATTYHLQNRGFIAGQDQRTEILQELLS